MFREDTYKRFQDALISSAKISLNRIGIYAVRDFMVRNSGRPETVLSIRSGRLSRAVMGQKSDINSDMVMEGVNNISISGLNVSAGKTIGVPYAARHEYGNEIPLTDQMRRAMFAHLKELGWYDKGTIGPKPGMVVMPARPYIRPTISRVGTEAKEILLKQLQDKFNTTTKITIGN